MKRRLFTLMEVMVGLALILIASGLVGWKMQQAIARKRFQSEIARLHSRFSVCQKLAIAMQADWQGVLKYEKDQLFFEATTSDNLKVKKMPCLTLHPMEIFFNGKKVNRLTIDFFSTGAVLPQGTLQLGKDPEAACFLHIPEMFQTTASSFSEKGPIRPDVYRS